MSPSLNHKQKDNNQKKIIIKTKQYTGIQSHHTLRYFYKIYRQTIFNVTNYQIINKLFSSFQKKILRD